MASRSAITTANNSRGPYVYTYRPAGTNCMFPLHASHRLSLATPSLCVLRRRIQHPPVRSLKQGRFAGIALLVCVIQPGVHFGFAWGRLVQLESRVLWSPRMIAGNVIEDHTFRAIIIEQTAVSVKRYKRQRLLALTGKLNQQLILISNQDLYIFSIIIAVKL